MASTPLFESVCWEGDHTLTLERVENEPDMVSLSIKVGEVTESDWLLTRNSAISLGAALRDWAKERTYRNVAEVMVK